MAKRIIKQAVAKQMSVFDTPEGKQAMEDKFVADYRNDINNLSYWYPKVKDCGIDQPRTVIIQNPVKIMQDIFEPESHLEEIMEFVNDKVLPQIPNDMFFLFVKNGTFSNKYNFGENCKCRREVLELTKAISNVNYFSECCGAGGISETVIREFIGDWHYIDTHIPCIYNGMPLRPEFRVFYDFEKRVSLYAVNYWDRDYCLDAISANATDKIVYVSVYQKLLSDYEKRSGEVLAMVDKAMVNVKALHGQWSVDIMYDEEHDKYWLIDMAVAQQSAYWNPEALVGE